MNKGSCGQGGPIHSGRIEGELPGAVGAAAGAGAGAAAASAVCVYYVIIVGRFAPPYKYIVEYIQQKQQQHLQKQLHCQC